MDIIKNASIASGSILVTGVGASMWRPVAMLRWEGGFLQK
jgi:hypothetical protein